MFQNSFNLLVRVSGSNQDYKCVIPINTTCMVQINTHAWFQSALSAWFQLTLSASFQSTLSAWLGSVPEADVWCPPRSERPKLNVALIFFGKYRKMKKKIPVFFFSKF